MCSRNASPAWLPARWSPNCTENCMSRNDFASGRAAFARGVAWVLAVGFAPMSAAAAQALPPHSEAAQEWPEVETVRTRLRADAAAALADCRIPGICPAGAAPVVAGEPMAA
ncbi:hypothetical protein G6F35_018616 [Rhizopus arrhizus]|nr:hypothetical protein G6F35_018616 [Rhizopus arrhizus]